MSRLHRAIHAATEAWQDDNGAWVTNVLALAEVVAATRDDARADERERQMRTAHHLNEAIDAARGITMRAIVTNPYLSQVESEQIVRAVREAFLPLDVLVATLTLEDV